MEYIILEQAKVPQLVEEVNSFIKMGWIPQGGMMPKFMKVQFSNMDNSEAFYQTMIKPAVSRNRGGDR